MIAELYSWFYLVIIQTTQKLLFLKGFITISLQEDKQNEKKGMGPTAQCYIDSFCHGHCTSHDCDG